MKAREAGGAGTCEVNAPGPRHCWLVRAQTRVQRLPNTAPGWTPLALDAARQCWEILQLFDV